MASELRVNTLKDASGNNSIATSFVAGGSAKAWASISGGGTPAIDDSLNVSGITDVSTGRRKPAYTNNMGNATYLVIAGVMADGNTNGARGASGSQIADRNAAYIDYTIYYGSSSGSDGGASDGATIDGIGIAGDLA